MNSSDHIIKSYDSELIRLTGEIVRMGELSVTQLEAAIDVIERRDERAAQRVVGNDEAIDQLEQDISHDVVRLLALRAPMAGDLRNVFAALRIAADIERIVQESIARLKGDKEDLDRAQSDFRQLMERPHTDERELLKALRAAV